MAPQPGPVASQHAAPEATTAPLRVGVACYPTFGGSGVIATEIATSLARRGHRVHVISYEMPFRFDRFVENLYFHEVEVRSYPLFEHGQYPLALASRLVEIATYEQLDILHVHYAIPHAASAYLARQIMGANAPRVIATLHGTDITVVGNDRSYLPITRFAIEQCDGVTVPSAYLRRATYENLGVRPSVPIEVIPNFVDTDKFQPAADKRWSVLSHLFPAAHAGSAPRVLVHNSNFRPLKRVTDVVRVLAEVRRHVPAVLVLIGDGPERSRAEALARELDLGDAVSFLGKQLDVAEVLQHADVFLLPSETESFGLAALEALACGLPVVTTRVGGLPEVVAEGETGYLTAVGDVAAMAAAVRRLLEDDALYARMSAAARARALDCWPREPMVARYERFYRRVLAR